MRKTRFALLILASVAGCAPRAAPLKGTLAPERALPAIELAGKHRRIVFRWDFEGENSLLARGEGAIRASAPDSARVDLFLNGGIALGRAILIGNTIRATNQSQIEKFLPPPLEKLRRTIVSGFWFLAGY